MAEKVECTLNVIQDFTGTDSDLDSDLHEGFTIGNGKTLYWYILWAKTGNARVCKAGVLYPKMRWVRGDSKITIHFKQLTA